MGNCCAADTQRQYTTDLKQKKKQSKKGESVQEKNNFNEFKEEYEKHEGQEELWTQPDEFETDDEESESEDFPSDKVTLTRKGTTKALFRKEFMDKVITKLDKAVRSRYKELGAYQYR